MGHIVSSMVAFASDHASLAYGLAFLLAAFEAFPVLGAAIPGTATIVALGALVPEGALSVWPLIMATTAGAIAGDGLSYWLGRSYKEGVAQIWPLRRNPALIEKGAAFFGKHGGKAILIARFTPGVRALVPVAAGILGMPVFWFYAANIMSAAVWGPAHVGVGVAIGSSFIFLGARAGGLIALVFGLIVIVCLVVWATPRLRGWLRQRYGS
jgi:membrane protein DedA with SNARE-associated domain